MIIYIIAKYLDIVIYLYIVIRYLNILETIFFLFLIRKHNKMKQINFNLKNLSILEIENRLETIRVEILIISDSLAELIEYIEAQADIDFARKVQA